MNGQHEMNQQQGAAAQDSRRTRKPEEVARILGVGRNQVYELIRKKQLRSVSIGRKLLIPLSAIDEFLMDQAD
jgi:excisionase family DNA binding protein